MPSRSEPCGLAQMIALRYGTVPVVRETGGLRDTIHDCGYGEGNGFTFASYSAVDMIHALVRAKNLYYDHPDEWDMLRRAGMRCDNSWKNAAGQYVALYKQMLTLW